MEPDLAMVLGIVLGGLSIPSILSAVSEGRSPRGASVVILLALGLIVYAATTKAGGYQLNELPDVFIRVIGGFLN